MEAAQHSTPSSLLREPPAVFTAWPRSAQLTTAFLLGLATCLLGIHTYTSSRWGGRPTELIPVESARYRIDVNRAGRAELLQIPGVGESLAQRIEDHRRDRGIFHTLDDLIEVRGIGPATLERIRPWVRVSGQGVEDSEASVPASESRTSARKSSALNKDPSGRPVAGRKEANLTGPIDINRATAVEFQRLPGIGPKLSQRIVDERSKGLFRSVEDLRRVSGIGPKILERLRQHVTVERDTPAS